MSCKVLNVSYCDIKGASFGERAVNFLNKETAADLFFYEVLLHGNTVKTLSVGSGIVKTSTGITISAAELEDLPVANYEHRLWWLHSGRKTLVFIGKYQVVNPGERGCCGESPNSQNVQLIEGGETIEISISEIANYVNFDNLTEAQKDELKGPKMEFSELTPAEIEELQVFKGELTPQTVIEPGKPAYWFAAPGTYPNAGGVTVTSNSAGIVRYDGVNFTVTEIASGWTVQTQEEEYTRTNGDKVVIKKVVDVVGGVGTAPAALTENIGKYYAAAGGFTADKELAANYKSELVPTGVVEEGNTKAVSGGEVYDYVKDELALKADVEEIIIKTSIVPITTEPYILSNTYFSSNKIHSLYGATLRYFKVFANVTYKIHIEGANYAVVYGTTLELPAVGVAVQGVTVPTIPNLNGVEVTPENDCYIIIGNGSKATVTSCYIETVLYGVGALSIENKERLDSLNASQISQNSDNESDILIPLSSYSKAGTSGDKIGMYFENLVGKKITGIHLKAFESGTLRYGISTITNNIAGDFVEKGTISVTSGESDYLFLEPILLAENQCIYIQGKRLYGVYQFNNSISFIDKFNNNSIIGTNFLFSYYLIVSNELSAVIDNQKIRIDNQEIRIKNLESIKPLNYAALGDSITWGSFGGELPSEHGNSYADYLSDMLGVTSFKKLGRAGDSIWLHFKNQIDKITPNTNLITFNFGVNDATLITQNVNPIEMGDYKTVIEMDNDNPTDSVASTMYNHSVLGRFRWCVEYLKNKFPDATIVCLTLPDVNHTDPDRIATYIYLREAEEAISAYLGIPFVNLLNVSPVFKVPKWNGFIKDFVHPLKYGYRMMAGAYYPFIKSLL